MKRIISALRVTMCITMITMITMMTAAAVAAPQSPAGAVSVDPSPVAQSIMEARRLIAEKPNAYNAYNALAAALVRRARETSDPADYAQAEEAVEKSLQLSPNNFDTRQIQVSILLGEHEYPDALAEAKALNKQVPDAVMVYGLLTDANIALGNYADAENSAQWMLNLRPGNSPALIRAAQLRELFGDVEGSDQLLEMAYQATPPTETGERAWLLTQMGHLRQISGNADASEKLFQQALEVFPDYPEAVGGLAKVRTTQRRYEEAVLLLQKLCNRTAAPQHLYELAEALSRAGRKNDAQKAFGEFESKALMESNTKNNTNRELIFYYADYAHQPGRALAVAKQEYSWRRDVYTLDAYAWALHVNRQDAEARKQIETALAVGVRDADLFRHAGEIALSIGDRPAAEHYLKESAELNAAGSEQAKTVSGGLSSSSSLSLR